MPSATVGTFITPRMTTTARQTPPEQRGKATAIVNVGGSFCQFVVAPLAGCFVCGLQVAFLATHRPVVIAACGLPAPMGGGPWAGGA